MNRLVAVIAVLPLLPAWSASAEIAIVKTANVMAFDQARNGFASVCFEPARDFDLLEDGSNRTEIGEQLKAGNFGAYVALGTQAALLLKDAISESPIIYAAVPNPRDIGLNEDHITGIEMTISFREQLVMLREIVKGVKKIGVLYTKPANEAFLADLNRAARDEDLTVVPAPISSVLDLPQVLSAITKNVDALWIPPDPSLASEETIRQIASAAAARKLSMVGPSDRYVRAGALFALAPDMLQAGRMAGEMANRILKGTRPSKIDEQKLENSTVILNLKAAAQLGVTIPRNIQDAASKVYE